MLVDVLIDALLDSIRLIPFLFFAYLLMEAVEHRSSEKMQNTLKRMGKLGPFIASLLGCVPQCGFSASAASLYSAGIISCGTLISVFLSTSDEAIPILVTVSGINIFLRFMHPSKAKASIYNTPFGMAYSLFAIPAGYNIRVVLFLSNKTPFSSLE